MMYQGALFISPSFVYFTIFSIPVFFIQYHPILDFQFNWQKCEIENKYISGRQRLVVTFYLSVFFFFFQTLTIEHFQND